MPVISRAPKRSAVAWVTLVVTALALSAAVSPSDSHAFWRGGSWSYPDGSDCKSSRQRIDPIGAIFHGTAAHWGFIGSYDAGTKVHHGHIEKHTGWDYNTKGVQKMAHSGGCYKMIGTMGKHKSDTLDYHARFWEHLDPPKDKYGKHSVVPATPHMDEHDHGKCQGDHVPRHMDLPVGGTGSGYDYARQRLYLALKTGEHKHFARTEYWGHTAPVNQCGGKYQVHGSGHVAIIRVGRK
ncbi:MAG TPA: hypothetical protein VF517_16910 [Thermoleophilaceae bacterium]|jgi:hypothetical protein